MGQQATAKERGQNPVPFHMKENLACAPLPLALTILRCSEWDTSCPPFAQGATCIACILLTGARLSGSPKAEKNRTTIYKEKALPRKELKSTETQALCYGERPKPRREREGEERGGSSSKPSLRTQPALSSACAKSQLS